MTNVKQCITHRKEAEESRAETEKMMMQERPPLLFAGGRKATQRVVRDIQKVTEIFKQFDRNQSGVIEPHEFMPLLATLLQQPQSELDKEEVWKTWKLVDEDGSNTVSFDEFHKWYCGTFAVEGLTDFRDFIKEDMVPEEQRQMREVAAKLGIDIFDIEKIWKEFKAIDTDSSGLIDYEEFKVLIHAELSPKPECPEVPPRIVDKFWLDVDSDRSGSVSFEEFADWYVNFLQGESPMEKYYGTVGRVARPGHS